MSRENRQVVQIATSSATIGGGNSQELDLDDRENLYALDSDGNIYMWTYGDSGHTSGWIEMSNPWHELSELKDSKKPKEGPAEKIAAWLEKMGDNWPDTPSEIAQRIRAGEWNA